MKKQSLPALSILEESKVQEFSQADKVVIVGLFPNTDSDEFKVFSTVAETLRESYVFGYTKSANALSKQKVVAPGFALFKQFDDKLNVFDGKYDVDSIVSFIETNATPLMGDIGPDNYEGYMKKGLPILYLFVANKKERDTVGPEVEPFAKEFRDKITFVYIDAGNFSIFDFSQIWCSC
jgi:protein disulfide-isomerase A1